MSRSSKGDDALGLGQETRNAPARNQVKTAPAKQKKPPSPRNCRDYLRRQTADAMPEIVSAFVDEAKEGSVAHFNALAKVGGFDQRTASDTPKRRRKSLARQLLDEVEKYEAKQAAELAAASQPTGQIDNHGPQERS